MSSSSAPSALPSSLNAPVAVVSADDHSAWVLICNGFGITVVVITLLVRTYVRFRVAPPFGLDDYTLAGGTALAIAQVGLVFAQVDDGFGKSIDQVADSNLTNIQKLGYAADILFITVLYVSKYSVVLFIKRLMGSRTNARVSWIILSAWLAFALASILLVSLRCDSYQPSLLYERVCNNLIKLCTAITILDSISEVALFGMSVNLIWGLQMSFAKKSKVVFMFAFRLPVIIISVLRFHYIKQQIASADPTLAGATVAVLTQTELSYSIVAATIPSLGHFLNAFVTNYGAMGGDTILGGSHIIDTAQSNGSRTLKDSFALRSQESAKRTASRNEKRAAEQIDTHELANMRQPEAIYNRISAGKRQHGGNDAVSVGSDDSTRGMIIKKEVTWHVDSESFRGRNSSSPDRVTEREQR